MYEPQVSPPTNQIGFIRSPVDFSQAVPSPAASQESRSSKVGAVQVAGNNNNEHDHKWPVAVAPGPEVLCIVRRPHKETAIPGFVTLQHI